VRKLSGSQSYGDARALSNSSWNTIFKVPEGDEGHSLQKSSVSAIEIRRSSGRFSPWSDDPMPSAGVFHLLNRREFTLNA